MKKLILMMVAVLMLQGCGLALHSTYGIPATEYAIRTDAEKELAVPITIGLVGVHGAATYGLWTVC